ncbi:MAG TPA: hypothetical protein VIF82_14445 [Burkholderiaceae bacterium]|jgi:hypothetical protein
MKNSSNKNTRVVNTNAPVKNDSKPRLPNERDTAPDIQSLEPSKKIKQAHDDVERGLVDTDLRKEPGVEATKNKISLPHVEKDREK